ncbi:barstar family protein [Paenibacillus sp. SYP-B4298]|uniref:barstar family protein n=1 Tax=Paenibacillus sp. SYP-B4298 TaxID=2996034 RepID=UPI0022DD902F|nr:barstar family protein [Paenibacillus sp. SYP-B4298]
MTVEKLFDEFSAVYQFPYYFSANWNSFEECINDLAWLQADAYIMCISNAENLLQLSNSDFDSFTSILADSVREWQDGRNLGAVVTSSTPFNIIFHCAKENEYELIMKLRESGILLERL